jgi:hypothetical protein
MRDRENYFTTPSKATSVHSPNCQRIPVGPCAQPGHAIPPLPHETWGQPVTVFGSTFLLPTAGT